MIGLGHRKKKNNDWSSRLTDGQTILLREKNRKAMCQRWKKGKRYERWGCWSRSGWLDLQLESEGNTEDNREQILIEMTIDFFAKDWMLNGRWGKSSRALRQRWSWAAKQTKGKEIKANGSLISGRHWHQKVDRLARLVFLLFKQIESKGIRTKDLQIERRGITLRRFPIEPRPREINDVHRDTRINLLFHLSWSMPCRTEVLGDVVGVLSKKSHRTSICQDKSRQISLQRSARVRQFSVKEWDSLQIRSTWTRRNTLLSHLEISFPHPADLNRGYRLFSFANVHGIHGHGDLHRWISEWMHRLPTTLVNGDGGIDVLEEKKDRSITNKGISTRPFQLEWFSMGFKLKRTWRSERKRRFLRSSLHIEWRIETESNIQSSSSLTCSAIRSFYNCLRIESIDSRSGQIRARRHSFGSRPLVQHSWRKRFHHFVFYHRMGQSQVDRIKFLDNPTFRSINSKRIDWHIPWENFRSTGRSARSSLVTIPRPVPRDADLFFSKRNSSLDIDGQRTRHLFRHLSLSPFHSVMSAPMRDHSASDEIQTDLFQRCDREEQWLKQFEHLWRRCQVSVRPHHNEINWRWSSGHRSVPCKSFIVQVDLSLHPLMPLFQCILSRRVLRMATVLLHGQRCLAIPSDSEEINSETIDSSSAKENCSSTIDIEERSEVSVDLHWESISLQLFFGVVSLGRVLVEEGCSSNEISLFFSSREVFFRCSTDAEDQRRDVDLDHCHVTPLHGGSQVRWRSHLAWSIEF